VCDEFGFEIQLTYYACQLTASRYAEDRQRLHFLNLFLQILEVNSVVFRFFYDFKAPTGMVKGENKMISFSE